MSSLFGFAARLRGIGGNVRVLSEKTYVFLPETHIFLRETYESLLNLRISLFDPHISWREIHEPRRELGGSGRELVNSSEESTNFLPESTTVFAARTKRRLGQYRQKAEWGGFFQNRGRDGAFIPKKISCLGRRGRGFPRDGSRYFKFSGLRRWRTFGTLRKNPTIAEKGRELRSKLELCATLKSKVANSMKT